MAALRSPFRYDFVGSFLRPQAIKNASSRPARSPATS